MSDSIENDEKFRKLFNRYVSEYTQVLFESSYLNNKRTADLSSIEFELSHELVIEKLKDKSINTLKHIFEYIDRRVERAVLEERNKEPILKLKEYPPVDIRYYANPLSDNRAEMMRVTSDGLCYIHKDYCADERVLKNLKKVLVEQIIKINPSLVLLPKFYIDFKYNNFAPCPILEVSVSFDNPGGIQHIVKKFYGTLIISICGDRFDIDLTNLAKYFSDEVNKIARYKYAPK